MYIPDGVDEPLCEDCLWKSVESPKVAPEKPVVGQCSKIEEGGWRRRGAGNRRPARTTRTTRTSGLRPPKNGEAKSGARTRRMERPKVARGNAVLGQNIIFKRESSGDSEDTDSYKNGKVA